MSRSSNTQHLSEELDTEFSWIPVAGPRNRTLRQNAKQHFDQHVLQQPFNRRGSLSASVQRYMGLKNPQLMLRRGWNRDKSLSDEEMEAARDEADLASLKRILRQGGGAPRGLITQTASADDLRTRYFQPKSEPGKTQDDEIARSTTAQPSTWTIDSSVCQRCRGINAENLSGGLPYVHSTLARLTSSSLTCRLCRLILEMTGFSTLGLTLARYRIALNIEERSQFLDVQDRCVAVEDHELDTRNHLSEITVQLQDLTPWEEHEHDLLMYDGSKPQYERDSERGELSDGNLEIQKTQLSEEDLLDLNAEQLRASFGWYTHNEAFTLRPQVVRSESGLRCFTENHDPARQLVKGISWIRPVGATTASASSFDVAADWLKRCLAEEKQSSSVCATNDHREPAYTPPSSPRLLCPFDDNGIFLPDNGQSGTTYSFDESRIAMELPNIQEELPSRLLEISDDATHVRIVETHSHEYRYVALSYCWGKDDGGDWKTTTRTFVNHSTVGVSAECLPLTLQHSITITRRLGLSHIWIDALCIVQDSSEDWAKEATKMAGVYFGSVLTIAASGARSWSDGCFNQHSRRVIERGPDSGCMVVVNSELSTGEISRLYVLSTDALRFGENTDTYYHGIWERYHRQLSGLAYSTLVHGSPLATRGWTFQEHQLPRRTLYYTSEQLFWECQHCRRSEDNFPIQQDLRKHPVLDSKPLTSDAVAELWYLGIVEDYSRRNLTFTKDKLVAVSALAKATYLRRPQPYIAGLWRDSIMHGIMWRRSGPGSKSRFSHCPSWSWASQDSAIQYLWTHAGVDRAKNWLSSYKVTVVSVDYVPSPISPFTDVLSAHIELRTLLTIGTVLNHTHRRNGGQNVQGNSGWSGHASIVEQRFEDTDGGYKLAAGLEQGLYLSEPNTDMIWYLEAVMDTPFGFHHRVAVAYLGLDNNETSVTDDPGAEDNNNNLVFMLLDPPNLDASAYTRVGIARFRSTWVRPRRGDIWRLSDHISEHPLARFQERTVRLR